MKFGKRLRFISCTAKALVVSVGAGLLVLLLWNLPTLLEPSCQGHRLNEWVELYGAYRFTTDHWETQSNVEIAIRKMGSRAIPYLEKWMRFKPVPSEFRTRDDEPAEYRALGAVAAFKVLGSNADSAIPSLARLANLPGDTPWENHDPAWGIEYNSLPNRRAVFALANIGPRAAPVLLKFGQQPFGQSPLRRRPSPLRDG